MFLPLAFNLTEGQRVYGVTQGILNETSGMMGAFGNLGAGIASVFILVYTFRFGRQLIEGGRFSAQMLTPYLIYLLICNFSWVTRPVSAFTSALQSSLVTTCYGANGTATNIMEEFMSSRSEWLKNQNSNYETAWKAFKESKDPEDIIETESSDTSEDGKKSSGFLKGIGHTIKVQVIEAYNWVKTKALEAMLLTKKMNDMIDSWLNYGLAAVVCILLQWLATAVGMAMQCFGGIVVAILLYFGPLTFAFALLPDNTGVIKSWFIRLCQFSLYSPICSLINVFTFKICFGLAQMDASISSILLLFCILVCNIFALFQVGSIASMIIEGASGGVSIGGGVQAISQGVGMLEGHRDRLAMKQESEENKILKSIDKALGGDYSKGAEGAGGPVSGQNPFKN